MTHHDPFYLPRPLNIAHRGARDVAPENTLAAFEAAIAAGADGVELDVGRCATGEIVVIHDATVDRTTNGSGRVSEMPFDQLRELDAGSFSDPAYARERIPTLAEALDLMAGRGRVNIEIKPVGPRANGIEGEVVEMVRARDMAEAVIISSFDPYVLQRTRRCAPEMRLGSLYAPGPQAWAMHIWRALFGQPNALHPYEGLTTAGLVAHAHRRGQRVNVWTVNERAEMERLIRLSVDGIITDHPALLHEALAQHS